MTASQRSGEPLLSIAAAARAAGLPYGTLRRLVHSGRVSTVEVAGSIRVRLSAVLQLIRDRPANAGSGLIRDSMAGPVSAAADEGRFHFPGAE